MIFIKAISEHDQTMLEVVEYEYDMLLLSAEKITNNITIIETNLFIESFLLHARNLICFLEAIGQKDDIMITDFENVKGESIIPIYLKLDKNMKKVINKHCQHLSKERLKRKFTWDINGIKKEILAGMTQFYSNLSKS